MGLSIIQSALGAVSSIGSAFGPHETTGLPQKPVNQAFAAALANKWETYYNKDLPQDVAYWTKEIAADGPERAWVNFATPHKGPPRSVNGVPATVLAAQLTPQIGGPYELSAGAVGSAASGASSGNWQPAGAIPGNVASVQATGLSPAATPTNAPAVQAGGAMTFLKTPTGMLLAGVVVLGVVLFLVKRKG